MTFVSRVLNSETFRRVRFCKIQSPVIPRELANSKESHSAIRLRRPAAWAASRDKFFLSPSTLFIRPMERSSRVESWRKKARLSSPGSGRGEKSLTFRRCPGERADFWLSMSLRLASIWARNPRSCGDLRALPDSDRRNTRFFWIEKRSNWTRDRLSIFFWSRGASLKSRFHPSPIRKRKGTARRKKITVRAARFMLFCFGM